LSRANFIPTSLSENHPCHLPTPTIAILYAFAANLGIATAKTGAAFWTGSSSLLAEAIHSYADCGNRYYCLSV